MITHSYRYAALVTVVVSRSSKRNQVAIGIDTTALEEVR
jgi:hypothetical protein